MTGNPDGTFGAPVTFDVGASGVQAVAIGDFNGDGQNDVAVTTFSGAAIMLGDGHGNLGTSRLFPAGSLPAALLAADFNGDHKKDLAIVNAGTNDVSILLGNGDGSFKPAQTFPVGQGPLGVAVGDFNGDGNLDLAVSDSNQFFGAQGLNGNTVAILLGVGNGGFQPPTFIAVASGPLGIAVSDFNRDGKQDIVVTNSSTDQVSILLGNGNGTFKTPAVFSVTSGFEPISRFAPSYVSVDDFNGDGNLDLVVANPSAATAAVLPGNGKGRFGKATNILVAAAPTSVLTGDYNRDGHRDFLTANSVGATVSVLLGKGTGKFVVEKEFATGSRADQIIVADFNQDGIPDVVTADGGIGFSGDTISILLGKKGGSFAPAGEVQVGLNPTGLAVGDFNHDGHLDLVIASAGTQIMGPGSLLLMLGNGDGTFQTAFKLGDFQHPDSVAVGDFNGDGNPDLVACTADARGATLLLGDGRGRFKSPSLISLNSACDQVLAADFNGDGKTDLVFRLERNPDSPVVFVALGQGDGTFSTPVGVSNDDVFGIATADLNNDGILDLVLIAPGQAIPFLGDGNGNFAPVSGVFLCPVPTLFHPQSGLVPAIADFNGDGFLDIAIANEFGQTTAILPGKGDGTFRPQQTFPGGGGEFSAVAAADFNRDHRSDLVLSGFDPRTGKGVVTLLQNTTPRR
jgi:hypothetical protein